MKKVSQLLVAVLLYIPLLAFSQILSKDFKITTSAPYPVVDGNSKEYFFDGESHTISVKTQGPKVTIQIFDIKSMKELTRKVYEDFVPGFKVQKVMQIGGRIYYLYDVFDKKEKQTVLYSREVNQKDASFGVPQVLLTSKNEITNSSFGNGASGPPTLFNMVFIRFEVFASFDQSKILIRYRTRPLNKKDSENYDILGFYVYTNKLEKLWGGEVTMPYTEKVMNNLAYTVDKDGNAFMLVYINTNQTFEWFQIGKDLTVKPNKVDIDGKLYFKQFIIKETPDGNFICAGYYANGIDFKVNWTGTMSKSFNTNGILYFKMNTQGKILEKHDHEFPLTLINQYESKRAQKKNADRESEGKAGIGDLMMTNFELNLDGSMLIVGEQKYFRKELVYTKQETVHYNADVIVTKIDSKGNVTWEKKLPKTQVLISGTMSASRGGGLGIRYIKGSDAYYILYLDNPVNANISMDEVPEKHQDGKGGYLTAYKLEDATGKTTKHTICSIEDIGGIEAYQFKTIRILDAMNKTFMLEVYIKGKQDDMIKLELLD